MFDFYVQHEYWFAATQLILAMLGMGATLAPSDFAKVVKDPKGFSVGIVLQILIVPLVAFALIAFIDNSENAVGLAIGLAVCAAIPGGTMSNVLTYLSGGHVALSIALTAFATVACLVTTPILLNLLVTQHLPPDFSMPAGRIAGEIGLCLLLPLLLGMIYLKLLPGSAPSLSRWSIRGSMFVIGLIVIGVLGAGRLDFEAFGFVNILWVVAFAALLLILSQVVPRLLRNSREDRVAICIEISVRNTNLGLLLKASLFPAAVGVADPVGDQVLFTILAYGGLMLIIAGVLVGVFRTQTGFREALE